VITKEKLVQQLIFEGLISLKDCFGVFKTNDQQNAVLIVILVFK